MKSWQQRYTVGQNKWHLLSLVTAINHPQLYRWIFSYIYSKWSILVISVIYVHQMAPFSGKSCLFSCVLCFYGRPRADHYIFILFLLLLSSFFPRLSSAVGDWMSTILPHMVWPCANLECRSEVCCMRLAENTGCKKVAKNRHLGTIAQLCWAVSSQLRHVSTIRKKLVKQQYLLHMSS